MWDTGSNRSSTVNWGNSGRILTLFNYKTLYTHLHGSPPTIISRQNFKYYKSILSAARILSRNLNFLKRLSQITPEVWGNLGQHVGKLEFKSYTGMTLVPNYPGNFWKFWSMHANVSLKVISWCCSQVKHEKVLTLSFMRVTKSLEQLYSVPLPHHISFRKIFLAVPNYPCVPNYPSWWYMALLP